MSNKIWTHSTNQATHKKKKYLPRLWVQKESALRILVYQCFLFLFFNNPAITINAALATITQFTFSIFGSLCVVVWTRTAGSMPRSLPQQASFTTNQQFKRGIRSALPRLGLIRAQMNTRLNRIQLTLFWCKLLINILFTVSIAIILKWSNHVPGKRVEVLFLKLFLKKQQIK